MAKNGDISEQIADVAIHVSSRASAYSDLSAKSISGSLHSFHIPVMGTGFTIDTPLRVSKYGIPSVISLVDDVLIEQMRLYHSEREGEVYEPIKQDHPDPRAARITAYLNLVGRIVSRQIASLRVAPFEPGSEICRFFDLLPDCPLRQLYEQMVESSDAQERIRIQALLRDGIRPGSIDVNIMTKLDCPRYHRGIKLPPKFNDAMSALRGYAMSDLQSAVIFSAGLNQHLYTYVGEFTDFFPNVNGQLNKRIILKISDFRSAAVQCRFLAKRGVWVSELRIESGLNCGGHAFPCGGQLLGPILEEFKQHREELAQSLWSTCVEVWRIKKIKIPSEPLQTCVTVQGGIGTGGEHAMLMRQYNVDGIGWGTPFLMAPDVTNVDDELLNRLIDCQAGDIYLSDSSPLGIPFWNLRTSPSEQARESRAAAGYPGSPCPKGYLRFNNTFTGAPLCLASHDYQHQMIAALKEQTPSPDRNRIDRVTRKSCICHELAGSALRKYSITQTVNPAVCPGPNLFWFSRRLDLDQLVYHIYGRRSVLDEEIRPHMFLQEIGVNIEYLENWLACDNDTGGSPLRTDVDSFSRTLLAGIRYYEDYIDRFAIRNTDSFRRQLSGYEHKLRQLMVTFSTSQQPYTPKGDAL